jgi:hypothetical protein
MVLRVGIGAALVIVPTVLLAGLEAPVWLWLGYFVVALLAVALVLFAGRRLS